MRNILLKDVMTFSKIMKQTNIKSSLIPIIENVKTKSNQKAEDGSAITDKDIEKIGMEVFFTIIEAAGDAEILIYKLLDDIFEGEKSVKDMEISEVMKNLTELAKRNDLISFFKSAGQLTS